MKTLILAATLGLVSLAAASPAQAQFNHRQWNQSERIHQGVRSGELNRREAYRLHRQQSRIARYEARSRHDGHGLSYRERARIHRMQARANHNIYNQKHDRQHRYGYRR